MDPRFEQLIGLLKEALQSESNVRKINRQFQLKAERLNPERVKQAAQEFTPRLDGLAEVTQKVLEEALGYARQLGQEEAAARPSVQPFRAEDFAKHLRAVVDRFQLEARQSRPSGIATTLRSLEVELKGLIVVEKSEVRIVTPTPGHAVDPGQLSTIRMSFSSIPVLPQQPGATSPDSSEK